MSFVTLQLAKEFCQIASSGQDSVMQALIDAAEVWIERHCCVRFRTGQTVSTVVDLPGGALSLFPSPGPIASVTSLVDLLGDNTPEPATDYANDAYSIWRPTGILWLGSAHVPRWRVTYKAGFTTATAPPVLKLCILQLVFRAYNSRGDQASGSTQSISANFRDLAAGDIDRMLRDVSFRSCIV